MPNRAPRPCRHPHCPAVTTASRPYCPKHLPQYEAERAEAIRRKRRREWDRKTDSKRPSAHRRGYGRRWDRLAKMVLAREPICRWKGCFEEATEVDHIVPRAEGGTDDDENLQPLCKRHHSMKTVREDGGLGKRKRSYVDPMGRKRER